jgi:threonine aldolase
MAKQNNLIVHMDGARLMNAVVASGISAKEYAACTDTAWIDLSKGLGCPIGGVLTGSVGFIEEAWYWKQRLGGAMRQSGMMAAAGLFALENNVSRLEEDHRNAQILGERLADIDGIDINVGNIQTNLIFFKVKTLNINAIQLSERLLEEGIRIGAMGEKDIRVVTHLDVDRVGVLEAADAIAKILVRNKN